MWASFWIGHTKDEHPGSRRNRRRHRVAEEVFQNIREVKSFVRENYEIQRYNSAIGVAFHAAVKLLTVRSIFGPIIGFFAFAGLALILWFGGREVLDGRLSAGELIAS